LRHAFDIEGGRQVVSYLILVGLGEVDVDGDGALFLSNKGVLGAGLEKEAGEKQALAGCGDDVAGNFDDGDKDGVVIFQTEKMIEIGLHAFGELTAH
jgi:hypothetical protein